VHRAVNAAAGRGPSAPRVFANFRRLMVLIRSARFRRDATVGLAE